MIKNLHNNTQIKSKPGNYYGHFDKHSNEVSIILVITDDNLPSFEYNNINNELVDKIKQKRRKLRSENLDRLNFFNLLCSHQDSEMENLQDFIRLRKILKKNLQQQARTTSWKKSEFVNNKDFNHFKQKNKKKSQQNFNIYGPINYIPKTYSRPPLPPFYRNKFWSNTSKYLVEENLHEDNYFPSSVVTNFLYSKYDFEHSTSTCTSDSEEFPIQKNDSFEFKSSERFESNQTRSLILERKIQVGDRPDKNLKLKNSFFKIHENDLPSSSSSSSSSNLSEDYNDDTVEFIRPIPRQNRVVFSESNIKEDEEKIKYEANLPRLPEPNSQMLKITKKFEFGQNTNNRNLGLKYVRKKDVGNGLKNLNQSDINNLSVIAEEEIISSSGSSSSICEDLEVARNVSINETYLNFDMNSSIQKDMDLASESLTSTVSSASNHDDYASDYFNNDEQDCHNQKEDFNSFRFVRDNDNSVDQQMSFNVLYKNYLKLAEQNFKSIPKKIKGFNENLVYI
ncbi:unnamed protein product [Brachionus calyciflorus]|uniref:Uncharacterized protein n=1 Tax=Brachionus calyciflorus TaxID=104777 RepID=A0A814ENC8_9BILA|nr:unnamed protein product [Brachionus calyciflorus]